MYFDQTIILNSDMNDHVGTFHLFTGRRQYGQGTIFCGKCAPHVIVFLPVPACILISCLFLSVFVPYSEKFSFDQKRTVIVHTKHC